MFVFLDANKSLFDLNYFFIIFLSVKRICQHLNKPQKIAILKVQYYYLYFICCINSIVAWPSPKFHLETRFRFFSSCTAEILYRGSLWCWYLRTGCANLGTLAKWSKFKMAARAYFMIFHNNSCYHSHRKFKTAPIVYDYLNNTVLM